MILRSGRQLYAALRISIGKTIAKDFHVMGILGWTNRREPKPAAEGTSPAQPINKRPKMDPEVAKERARRNSPWRYDDGPSRRPVGGK
ncbi:MAG TPA: hypothetical protein PKE16_18555 [Hyphomicrobium sp.]|nr:hypothetical protein [Hyphomicrobium sp.]